MHRYTKLLICLGAASLSSTALSAPADRFAAVEMKAQHVAGSIHMLEGAGGNIGVSVGTDGTLIVDDQFAPLADKIIAALKGLGGDKPKLILNTHYHGDHTGSNPTMGKTGTIISHDNVRVRLLNEEDFPRSGLPLVTFDDDISVHFNDENIALIHLPNGHTDGDAVVWFKSANVIHMGDHFFKNRYPYIDVAGGGTVDGFISNVESVITMIPADIKIIPGHGKLSNVDDLKDTIASVKASVELVRAGLAADKATADIMAELDSEFASMGSGFINAERWIQIIQADANR